MALVNYRETRIQKELERARYLDSLLWMVLLILFSVFIIGLCADRFPTKSQPDSHVSMHAGPNNPGPAVAELVPIFSGNPGGSSSLGGGVSLGGGATH